MHEKQSAMDQVVAVRLDADVVTAAITAAHFDVALLHIAEEPRVDVGGDDVSGRAHPLAQPTHDRATAGADLQTAPPLANPDRVKVAERVTIALRLDELQASTLIARLGISCKVARHSAILTR